MLAREPSGAARAFEEYATWQHAYAAIERLAIAATAPASTPVMHA